MLGERFTVSTSTIIRRHRRSARALPRAAAGALAAALLATPLVVASSAGAHATLQLYGEKAQAGGYGAMWVRIPHGCEGKATRRVQVLLPATFGSARPQLLAGWRAQVRLTEDGSRVVTWTARGRGLPDGQFADFGISVKWPERAGVTYVPVVQRCGRGAMVAWNQIPIAGGPEPEYPAPSVTVHRSSGAHH